MLSLYFFFFYILGKVVCEIFCLHWHTIENVLNFKIVYIICCYIAVYFRDTTLRILFMSSQINTIVLVNDYYIHTTI